MLPPVARRKPRLGFFSGSTIGNLTHAEARAFLSNAARLLGPGSAFLLGVDLKKSESILSPPITMREASPPPSISICWRASIASLAATFDLSRFAHDAVWNADAGRIEMYLVSLAEQTVHVPDRAFAFAEGERIHTENSHKYTVDEFRLLASASGWRPVKAWTDPDQLFSLHLLRLRVSRLGAQCHSTLRGTPGTPSGHSKAARSHLPSEAAAS